MANYLPVLLVSVNGIPDDSSLDTLPRSQVDYLSHDWREEDVWRSWRNMTRQKNEITNGMRLENASWRTWWKQRNKLKTITPETLNWLKDSDVTWLYGPLHTAGDWTPPPKPKSDSPSLDKDQPALDRLDLSLHDPNYKKPILKHRSISEFLTSDLPASPLFSPAESEDESTSLDRCIALGRDDIDGNSIDKTSLYPTRPPLLQTKSDSHVTRWGPNRAFRKNSPPRVVAADQGCDSPLSHGSSVGSKTDLTSYFELNSGPSSSSQYKATQLRPNSPRLVAPSDDVTAFPNGARKKHITFNTFVEQCIAIDKPKSGGDDTDDDDWPSRNKVAYEDDGYEEDEEDGFEDEDSSLWPVDGSAIVSDSESDYEEDQEEEEMLSMRRSPSSPARQLENAPIPTTPPIPSEYRSTPPKKRSKSKVSNASSSTTSSSSSTRSSSSQFPPKRTPKSRSQSSNIPPVRAPKSILRTSSLGDREPLTIAPIAPTMLKTEGTGGDWEDYDPDYSWADSVFLEGKDDLRRTSDPERIGKDRDSVDLVYVPPTWRSCDISEGSEEGDEDEVQQTLYEYSPQQGVSSLDVKVTPPSPPSMRKGQSQPAPIPENSGHSPPPSEPFLPSTTRITDSPQPIDIPDRSGVSDASPLGFIRGPDYAEDFGGRRSRQQEDQSMTFGFPLRRYPTNSVSIAEAWAGQCVASPGKESTSDELPRGRSRSRSRSRTPSPAISSSPPSHALSSRPAVAIPPRRHNSLDQKQGSASSPSLLSPPQRGRGRTAHGSLSPPEQSRGRSSTRTSSSFSDRERSSQASSLSLSPEGSGTSIGVVASGSAYANGRKTEVVRAREREREKEKERGRERVERGRGRTSERTSSEDSTGLSLSPEPVYEERRNKLLTSPRGTVRRKDADREDVSSNSSSSTVTVVPASTSTSTPPHSHPQVQQQHTLIPVLEVPDQEEMEMDDKRRTTPMTPSNSPVRSIQISGQSVASPLHSSPPPPTTSTTESRTLSPSSAQRYSPSQPPRHPLHVPHPTPSSPSTTVTHSSPVQAILNSSPSTECPPLSPRRNSRSGSSSPAIDAAESTLSKPSSKRNRSSWDGAVMSTKGGDREESSGLVGKIVTSAGSYFGLWQGSTAPNASA